MRERVQRSSLANYSERGMLEALLAAHPVENVSLSLSLRCSSIKRLKLARRKKRAYRNTRVGHAELDGCPLLFKAACVHACVP